jgi:hypothetical protein
VVSMSIDNGRLMGMTCESHLCAITKMNTRQGLPHEARSKSFSSGLCERCNSISPRRLSSFTAILLASRPPSLTPLPYTADQRDSLAFMLDLWEILLSLAFDGLRECFLPTPVLAAKLNPPACRHWLCAVSSEGWSNASSHRSHRYWMICDGDIFGGLCRWLICGALEHMMAHIMAHIMAQNGSVGFTPMDERCGQLSNP